MSNKTITAMTTAAFTEIATQNISKLSTSDLMTEITKLNADNSTAATMVWSIAMDILMDRISENDFITFCNTLS